MNAALSVLIVEDDPNLQLACEQALELADIPVACVGSAEEGMEQILRTSPGVVVTDMRLPKADGLSLLRWAQARDAAMPVIMVTGHGDVTLAVEAMRSGAYDFIPKPFSPENLVEVVRRALEKRSLTLEVAELRRRLERREGVETALIGRSPQMAKVRQLVADVAGKNVDVLVHGETGTGKELVARCLHDLGPRARGNFVALNCGGLPDNLIDSELFGHEPGAFTGASKRRIGKIEHASGGTLFLDEVESMPMGVQIKLLRVLQERVIERLGSNQVLPVDTRVVAATKEDLAALSEQQRFRLDLYYRLNVVTIELPPLRDRREDIPMLLEDFMLHAARRHDLPLPTARPEQLQRLMAHNWPGNVRELRNVADCLVLGVERDVLGSREGHARPSLTEAVDTFERSLIAEELRRQGGNLSRTAEILRVAKTTLHDKIRKFHLGG
jgi:two-component system C4-dicarboxylate transport response regulator DctD